MKFVPALSVPLKDLLSVWNAAMGAAFPLRLELLQQNLSDLNFLTGASFAAIADRQTVGFILCKQNREHMGVLVPRLGYISALAVAPEYRREGIGSRLLDLARRALTQRGVEAIRLGGDTYHFFPGVPEEMETALRFFIHRGAEMDDSRPADLVRNITHYEHPPEVLQTLQQANCQFRPAAAGDLPELMRFLTREFPGRWSYERQKFFYAGGDPADVIIGEQEGEIVAFCQTYTQRSRQIGPSIYWSTLLGEHYGGIGPLGVARHARGRGLGLAVVAVSVAQLKRRGVRRAAIDWTTLVDFYERLGFKVWKRYVPGYLPVSR